jgi:hypothetical protein
MKIKQLVRVGGLTFDTTKTGRADWDKLLTDGSHRVKLVYMSPDEYLERTQSWRYTLDQKKVDAILRSLGDGTVLPTPVMVWDNDTAAAKHPSSFHDGQHRVAALKQLGLSRIPVLQLIANH